MILKALCHDIKVFIIAEAWRGSSYGRWTPSSALRLALHNTWLVSSKAYVYKQNILTKSLYSHDTLIIVQCFMLSQNWLVHNYRCMNITVFVDDLHLYYWKLLPIFMLVYEINQIVSIVVFYSSVTFYPYLPQHTHSMSLQSFCWNRRHWRGRGCHTGHGITTGRFCLWQPLFIWLADHDIKGIVSQYKA